VAGDTLVTITVNGTKAMQFRQTVATPPKANLKYTRAKIGTLKLEEKDNFELQGNIESLIVNYTKNDDDGPSYKLTNRIELVHNYTNSDAFQTFLSCPTGANGYAIVTKEGQTDQLVGYDLSDFSRKQSLDLGLNGATTLSMGCRDQDYNQVECSNLVGVFNGGGYGVILARLKEGYKQYLNTEPVDR
jgi:hypothetical protein